MQTASQLTLEDARRVGAAARAVGVSGVLSSQTGLIAAAGVAAL